MSSLTKEEKLFLFSKAPVSQAILKLALPTILSQLITMIYNLADTFFVGRIGDPYQTAALSLVFPLTMLIVMMGNLFGIGGNVVIAKSLGENNYEKVKKVSAFSFYGAIVASFILSFIFIIFNKNILTFMGASENTFNFAKSYLIYVIMIGAPPTVLQLVLAHMLRAEGAAKQAGNGLMLGGIINIVLDPLFILWLKNGIVGAAIATLIANCISLIYIILMLRKNYKNSFLSFKISDFSFKYAPEVLINGLQAAIVVVFGASANIVMTKTASSFNDIAVASFGIMQKYTTMCVNIATGFGQGVMPLLGYNYAAKDFNRIKEVNKAAFKFDGIFAVVFVSLVEIFPAFFAGLFTTHPETIAATAIFIRLGFIGSAGTILMNFMTSSFQAFGKWQRGIIMNFIRQIVLYVPLILILSKIYGVNGLALSFAVSEIIAFFIALILYIQMLNNIKKEIQI